MGTNHGYARQIKDTTNHGGAFTTSVGQEDLVTPSGGSGASINKEMWLIFNRSTQDEWIETGDTKGLIADNLSQSNLSLSQKTKSWAGHFLAYKKSLGNGVYEYHETAYGSYAPTGVHSYSISYIGLNSSGVPTWVIYANGARVLTLNQFNYTNAQRLQIGIETKDTTNYFYTGTIATDIQGKDTNGIWHNFTTATNADVNTQSVAYGPWTSTFYSNSSNGANSITFAHR